METNQNREELPKYAEYIKNNTVCKWVLSYS